MSPRSRRSKTAGSKTASGRMARSAFIAAILTALASFAATLLTDASGLTPHERKQVVLLLLVLLSLALIVLLCITYFADMLSVFRERSSALEAREADVASKSMVIASVPRTVEFDRRRDRLVVEPNGDATLEWDFSMVSPAGETVTDLGFLLYGEVDKGKRGPSNANALEVQSLLVNGVQRARGSLSFRWRRNSGSPSVDLECWLLSMPVSLRRLDDRCDITAIIKFHGVFSNASVREEFYVDIPYLTRDLLVEVRASPQYAVRHCPGGGPHVKATSVLMEASDPREAQRSGESEENGDALVWHTTAPKLGYRYTLAFRLEPLEPVTKI